MGSATPFVDVSELCANYCRSPQRDWFFREESDPDGVYDMHQLIQSQGIDRKFADRMFAIHTTIENLARAGGINKGLNENSARETFNDPNHRDPVDRRNPRTNGEILIAAKDDMDTLKAEIHRIYGLVSTFATNKETEHRWNNYLENEINYFDENAAQIYAISETAQKAQQSLSEKTPAAERLKYLREKHNRPTGIS